ncbi:unnamed protein product [Allacma fusca]|uniref:RING-type domain-containing protein n=1 Tax=Allacma fusca TaxID=39272 RepID=A0A8J2J8P1_9HEXA|nr:unnamed protein product [Allacma fusca]
MTEGLECPICKNAHSNNENEAAEDCFVSTAKGHVFHYTCLQRWVDEGKTQCPNCTESLGRNTVLRLIGVQSATPRRVSLHQEAFNSQLKDKSLNNPKTDTSLYDLPCVTAKIVALGDAGVGKSSLIRRFMNETFEDRYNATIGCDMNVKTIEVAGKLVQLHLWETAGQERFRSVVTNYVRNADGILLVYDVTCQNSIRSIDRWIAFAKDYGPPDSIKVLIGNKFDQKERCIISKRKGKELADRLEMPFFETSAKSSLNVEVVFRTLAAEILLSPEIQERNREEKMARSFSISQPEGKHHKSNKGFNCC